MNLLIVDGGGTKTKAWLLAGSPPQVRQEVTVGRSGFGAVGAEGLIAVLRELGAHLPGDQSLDATVLGLAGVGRPADRDRAFAAARTVFEQGELFLISDAELAYRGAFAEGKHGILLITGTGSIALYRTPIAHEFSRAGGWGPLLGDEGSGAWFGREALRNCLYEWEQDELGPLHAAVLEHLAIEHAAQILTKVYQENYGPREWAELAPLVFRYAREDMGALAILKRAAIELVALCERLQKTLAPEGQTVPVAVVGGLWEHRHHLQPLMEEEIRLRNLPLYIAEPVGGPLDGGLLYLREIGRLRM